MEIHVQLTRKPIPSLAAAEVSCAGRTGALTEFRGMVRDEENGQLIAALEYEAYEDMALREMNRLLLELEAECPCLSVVVVHRIGIIPVGEAAIALQVASRHRAEGLALAKRFMDRLKQDVPIWKVRAVPRPDPPQAAAASFGTPGVLEMVELISRGCAPLAAERVPLDAAAGRFLREEIRAPEDQPLFDRSAVDGYAIRLDDTASEFKVIDEIRAGEWKPRVLAQGEAVRIATGAALPSDHLKVVMNEDVEVLDGRLRVLTSDGETHVRSRGENARAGDVLIGPGLLRPGSLALLASLGATTPLVSRVPRVLHLATGDEIVPPDVTPRPGQIRDSNSILIRSFLQCFGIEPRQLHVGEDPDGARAALRNHAGQTDLLVISGGASVGEHDFTRQLLVEAGYEIRVSRTRVRPGKPSIFGIAPDGRIAFGLPGNPLAHFICLNLFVRAAIEALMGLPRRELFERAELGEPIVDAEHERETLWPAQVRVVAGSRMLVPLPWQNSGDLTCLARANALIHLPPHSKRLPAGTQVLFATTHITR